MYRLSTRPSSLTTRPSKQAQSQSLAASRLLVPSCQLLRTCVRLDGRLIPGPLPASKGIVTQRCCPRSLRSPVASETGLDDEVLYLSTLLQRLSSASNIDEQVNKLGETVRREN